MKGVFSMADISLKHVSKVYPGGSTAVSDFNLDIQDRELVMIVGPSGCGKSTTLRMLAGLESVSEGQILIDGKDVTKLEPQKRDLSMVFQSYALYPHMSVYDNLAFGLRVRGFSKAEIDSRVRDAARMLEIEQLLDRKPAALSGGQKQRVAIGAAIVRKAKAYLMDEPLSNLDAKLRAQMRVEIAKLHENLEAAIVYVTHDQVEAMTLATRIVVMNHGVVQQAASPAEIYRNPINHFVAGFIGSPQMNFIPVDVVKLNGQVQLVGDGLCLALPAEAAAVTEEWGYVERQLILGVRPEDFYTPREGRTNEVSFELDVKENLGAEYLLHGQIGLDKYRGISEDITKDMISIRVKDGRDYQAGDRIAFSIRKEHIHLFDPKTGNNILYETRKG